MENVRGRRHCRANDVFNDQSLAFFHGAAFFSHFPSWQAVGKKVAEKIPVKKDDKLKAKVYRALSPNKLNLKVGRTV